jgi:TRAP-type C4-dicarboxylate transport system permease small subunit
VPMALIYSVLPVSGALMLLVAAGRIALVVTGSPLPEALTSPAARTAVGSE